MEIFEFLNVCQVHGFPKIMGVLTHLDLLKNNKALKKTKKKLKSRFWTEVYQVQFMIHVNLSEVTTQNAAGGFVPEVLNSRDLID